MRSHTRLLLVLVLIGAFSTLVIDLVAARLLDAAAIQRSVERLRAESDHLASSLAGRWPRDPAQARAFVLGAASSLRVRVLLADTAGRILADSEPDLASATPDPARRPELVAAAREGFGQASTAAGTSGGAAERVARRVGPDGASPGFLILEAPLLAIDAPSSTLRLRITWLAGGTMALLCLVAYVSLRRVLRPVRRVARAADRVAAGQYDLEMETGREDEIGDLYASVDRMRRALIGQMGTAESERRLIASILGGIREGILAVTEDRRVLMANDALKTTLGVERGPDPGMPLYQCVWDRAIVEAYDTALTLGREERRRVALPGGRAAELTVVPFVDAAGRHAGAIGLFFDVTRIEALERVRKDFVADISHELRTPLASMRAAAETLGSGAISDPPEAERFLAILQKNASRMESILDDLTDLSLIETGGISLTPAPVDLGSAVREAAAGLALRASQRGVSIAQRIPAGLTVLADRRRLDQILVNLLDNAIKFNRPGGSVIASAFRQEGTIRLTVEDTGQGLPPEALERVFNRFYRVDRARSREIAGTGMGLAIVKHLVLLHGGDVHAENRDEGGARFTVTLPASPPE